MTSTLDLLESAQTALTTANQQLGGAPEQLLQRWKEWKEGQPKEMVREAIGEADVDPAKDQGEVENSTYNAL